MADLVRNNQGYANPDEILKKFVSLNGLLKKIFWELHDNIVYDREAEFCKRMLREVYGFKDSDKIFPQMLAEARFHKTMETIFRFFKPEATWIIQTK